MPGALDGWWTLHQRYGKLKWADLFEPAIAYAEEGAPVPEIIAYYIRAAMRAFVRPGAGIEETANAVRTWGKGPQTGEIFRNPDLARTYKLIAAGGRDAYYDGPIADTIERYFQRIGGWMTRADLAGQHAEWFEPGKRHRQSPRQQPDGDPSAIQRRNRRQVEDGQDDVEDQRVLEVVGDPRRRRLRSHARTQRQPFGLWHGPIRR